MDPRLLLVGRPSGKRVDMQANAEPYTGLFVHWGGCPRPGPVPIPWSTVPLADRWRQLYYTYCRKHGDWIGCAKDSSDFLALMGYQGLSSLKRRLF
jgi:hypothetical protein